MSHETPRALRPGAHFSRARPRPRVKHLRLVRQPALVRQPMRHTHGDQPARPGDLDRPLPSSSGAWPRQAGAPGAAPACSTAGRVAVTSTRRGPPTAGKSAAHGSSKRPRCAGVHSGRHVPPCTHPRARRPAHSPRIRFARPAYRSSGHSRKPEVRHRARGVCATGTRGGVVYA